MDLKGDSLASHVLSVLTLVTPLPGYLPNPPVPESAPFST